MSIFTDSMRRFWVPGITNVQSDLNLTVGSWLEKSAYYVKNVVDPGTFIIEFSDINEVGELFAVTANKTMSGCFESIASITEVQRAPRSVAWLLIKLYYAAFFAAHGHMRTCGVSCLNLDAQDATRILESANLYGTAGGVQKINGGQYKVILDAEKSTLTFSLIKANGSHEALWIAYKSFIDKLIVDSENIISVELQRDIFKERLNSLQKVLCHQGMNGGNWLSRFRNSVQYRQGYGAWYPYTLSKRTPKKLVHNIVAIFKCDPGDVIINSSAGSVDAEVEAFYNCALLLSSLARSTTIELSSRSTNKSSVVRRGAITFLKQAELN